MERVKVLYDDDRVLGDSCVLDEESMRQRSV